MLEFAPPNDCLEAREAISARLDAELSELDEARLDAHLRQCGACQAFASDVALLTANLRCTPLEPVPARAFVVHRRRLGGSAAAAVAAAVLLVAAAAPSFFAGRFLASHGHPHQAPAAVGLLSGPIGVPRNGIDPGIVALLDGTGAGSGRIIPV